MFAFLRFIVRNLLSIALLVFGIVAGVLAIGMIEDIRTFLFPETAAHVRSNITIIESIQGIGQLVTLRSEMAKPDIRVDIKGGLFGIVRYSANHIAVGAVEAGIDFDALDEGSIQFQDDTYTLTLPAPVITSCRIEHIDQNQHSIALLGADWDMVRQIAHAEAITGFARKMIEEGILERAEEEAAWRLVDFVSALTGRPVRVEFSERVGKLELPLSCQPVAPSGWEKDDDGAWKRAA